MYSMGRGASEDARTGQEGNSWKQSWTQVGFQGSLGVGMEQHLTLKHHTEASQHSSKTEHLYFPEFFRRALCLLKDKIL